VLCINDIVGIHVPESGSLNFHYGLIHLAEATGSERSHDERTNRDPTTYAKSRDEQQPIKD